MVPWDSQLTLPLALAYAHTQSVQMAGVDVAMAAVESEPRLQKKIAQLTKVRRESPRPMPVLACTHACSILAPLVTNPHSSSLL